MEAVVDGAVALSLSEPGIKAFLHLLPVTLDREVDDGGRSTPCCGLGAVLKVVGGEGAAEGQFHVGVAVDTAGNHVFASGVDYPLGPGLCAYSHRRTGLKHRHDLFTVDKNLRRVGPGCADDGSALDKCGHDVRSVSDNSISLSSVLAQLGDGAEDCLCALIDLCFAHVQHRGQTQHVAVEAALTDQQPTLTAGLEQLG